MSIIKRSAWGAAPARKRTPLRKPKGVAIHWVGVAVIGDPRDQVKSIQRYHQETKGWWDIAYNVLCGDGVSLNGRGWTNRSGANGTSYGNRNYGAICLLLGPGQKVKDGHIDAVRTQIAALRRSHPGALEIVAHRELKKSTTCPGDEIFALIENGVFEPGNPMPGKAPSPLPSSGYPIPTRTLRRGDVGDEVAWVQFQLQQRGHRLIIDGVLGPKTVRAIRKYQRSAFLVDDGIVGPNTLSSLIGAAL